MKIKSINKVSQFHSEEGAILPIVAIVLIILLGFAAFAIDFGFVYMRQAQLQSVADAEALVCASNYLTCNSTGDNYPLTNPYGFVITTTNPVACPNTNTQKNCVSASAANTWNTYFLPLFGINSFNLSKTAIAGTPIIADVLIIRDTIKMNGTNIMTVTGGSVSDGGGISTTNSSGIDATASGATITAYNSSTNSCGSCTPAVTSSSLPQPIPSAYVPPTPPASKVYASGCSLPSGTYAAPVNLNACGTQVNMSGVYYFNGGFNNQGITLANLPGAPVTIIVGVDQPFTLSGSVTLNSSDGSSTCGTVGGGMVIYQPLSLTNTLYTIDVAGTGNNISLTGKTQLPNTNFIFRGSPTSFIIKGSLYANSMDLRGNMTATTSPDPCQNINLSSGKVKLLQ